jgi:hypothetical protein
MLTLIVVNGSYFFCHQLVIELGVGDAQTYLKGLLGYFELPVWNKYICPKYGWPPLKAEQLRCTMATALAMGLPASLDAAAKAVNLPEEKAED